ncbi:hypothetical protein RCH33_2467 [Flavobacterium daejeonense]|nr:hypothetical protein RCH33_2467 [Flavobacterium daejeonense]
MAETALVSKIISLTKYNNFKLQPHFFLENEADFFLEIF